jgi:hypothetical protein
MALPFLWPDGAANLPDEQLITEPGKIVGLN